MTITPLRPALSGGAVLDGDGRAVWFPSWRDARDELKVRDAARTSIDYPNTADLGTPETGVST